MNNNLDTSLNSGIIKAKVLTKHYGKTFYFASLLLPKQKRNAAYVVYAFCRLSDDSVDKNIDSDKAKALNQLKQSLDLAYSLAPMNDSLLLAFRQVVSQYNIPKEYFLKLLYGMQLDLKKNSCENFKELKEYCYYVAGVVGLIMVKIFGYTNPEAQKYAIDLGIAMQLTNILRDIKEDYQLNRIYLPKNTLADFNVSADDIKQNRLTNDFKKLMKYQISLARDYYKSAIKGVRLIDNWRCRLVVYAMQELYSQILNSIENNNYDIFSKRAYISNLKKILLTTKILLGGKYLWP